MENKFIWSYLMHITPHISLGRMSKSDSWYPKQVIREGIDVSIDVWDGTIKHLAETGINTVVIDVGDGIKYESHPEISTHDAWSKDFLKKKLDEIRALGMEPIPKLNFSTNHDHWMGMYHRFVSTPTYYNFCADIIREVAEAFEYPSLFHLGMDEEETQGIGPEGRDLVVIRNGELWWHDLNFLCKEVEKHGCRPWIWSDHIWVEKDTYLEKMSKSVLQSYWYYARFRDYPEGHNYNKLLTTYGLLDEHGFDQVPTCSCFSNIYNSRETLAHGKTVLSKERLKGFMAAPWKFAFPENRFDLLKEAEIFYYARKEIYPETL